MAKTKAPVESRFMEKVDKTDSCWLWTAWIERNGYGRFWLDGRQQGAHRVAYELYVQPIPAGMEIDHLCRVRHCVNPSHLEAVTPVENVLRAIPFKTPYQSLRSECPNGHPYDTDNAIPTATGRQCRTCKKDANRAYCERNRELVKERARKWSADNPEKSRESGRLAQARYRAKKKASI